MRQILVAILLGIAFHAHITLGCNLRCENARLSDRYDNADKKLNLAYHQLSTSLDQTRRSELRTIQRKWITQRDSVCTEREQDWCTESGCIIGPQIISASNEGLQCLIDATEKRTKEIQQAGKAVKSGKRGTFVFSPL